MHFFHYTKSEIDSLPINEFWFLVSESFNISNLHHGLSKYQMLEPTELSKKDINDLLEYERKFKELNQGKSHGRR